MEARGMPKKRSTLIRNFNDMIKAKDMEALKAVFDKCDMNATGGYGKGTALHFHGLSDEMIHWLVENGANIDAVNEYQCTPLLAAASLRAGKLEIFIALGANVKAVDGNGDTALHFAAGYGFSPTNVKLLLDHGAVASARNKRGETPLEYALVRASNGDIEELAEICVQLLPLQNCITKEMKQAVTELGKSFAFYRADFNLDYVVQTEVALHRLYELFDVQPIAKRGKFDGISPIKIDALEWQKQFDELWELLVPVSGFASSVQGEVIRICGKVTREILDNGAVNWNKEYKKLSKSLPMYFAMGIQLEPSGYKEAEKLANHISANSCEDALTRLCELAVTWVLLNPEPIMLTSVAYER